MSLSVCGPACGVMYLWSFGVCMCEVYLYLAQLSDSGMCGFADLLSINGVLSEEQIDLVVFRVVTLWDEMHTDKSRVWKDNKQKINTKKLKYIIQK